MAHRAGVPRSRSISSAVSSAAPAEQALQFAGTLARSCSRALAETVAAPTPAPPMEAYLELTAGASTSFGTPSTNATTTRPSRSTQHRSPSS